jgi:putative ABC transport system permease protein
MKFRDLLKLALRTFKARRGRTALTVLGMGIGIGAILFLVGLGYGLQNLLLQEITTSESLGTLDVSANKANGAFLTPGSVKEISEMPDVAGAVAAFDAGAQVKFKGTSADGSIVIANPEFFALDGKKIKKGKKFEKGEREGLVLSSAFTKIFNESEDALIGQTVNLSVRVPKKSADGSGDEKKEQAEKVDVPTDFKVAGLFESEELLAFASPEGFEEALSIENYSRLKVKCASGEALDGLRGRISEKGFSVSSLSDTVEEVNKMFRGIKGVLAVFGMVALLVSAIGMFNTMTVALLERTKEIGIMKAIGASNGQILGMFILESTAMGFLGGVSGIILGVLSGVVFNVLLNLFALRMGGKSIILFSFPIWFLLFILGFSVAIGFFTGLIPARRASTVDPLEALKSK